MVRRVLQGWSVPVLALAGLLLTTGFAAAQPRLAQGQQLYNWSGHYGGSSGWYGSAPGGGYYGTPYSYGTPYNYAWPNGNAFSYYQPMPMSPGYNYGGYSYSFPMSPNYSYGAFQPNGSGYYGAMPREDQARSANEALIHVNVPADAQVWFNDTPTRMTGPSRDFFSPPLQPDHDYTYKVRASWKDGDRNVDQSRTVTVRAGQRTNVDFLEHENEKTEK